MSKYIYSRWSDKDFLFLNETNLVANMYEMLGIYISYSNNSGDSEFYDYYLENVGLRPFHFRNIGERKVKECLQSKGEHIPRRNLRFLSQTWAYFPVIASDDMDKIFSELVDSIYSSDALKKVFLTQAWTRTPDRILGFQHKFLNRYLKIKAQINSTKKGKIFKAVFAALEANRIFKNQ